MKRSVVYLMLLLLISQSAYAKAYVVKYENETGEIQAWGAMSGLETSPGEGIIETDMSLEDINCCLVKAGKIVEKNIAEKKIDADAAKAELLLRKQRKQIIANTLGLTNSEDIQNLREILEDGNLD